MRVVEDGIDERTRRDVGRRFGRREIQNRSSRRRWFCRRGIQSGSSREVMGAASRIKSRIAHGQSHCKQNGGGAGVCNRRGVPRGRRYMVQPNALRGTVP